MAENAIAFLWRSLHMHLPAYLRTARTIVDEYKEEQPFASWLKNFFRQHKKYGSRDRKLIADLCFCYYRLGLAFNQYSTEEQLLIGQFLCHEESVFIRELKPEWQEKEAAPVFEKIVFLNGKNSPFPFPEEVSGEIEPTSFGFSFFQKPDLFLRVRPGKEKKVAKKLSEAGISVQQEGACLRLPNSTKVEEVLCLDEEAVVQDISSQRVIEPLLQHRTPNARTQTAAWDCCAASGGKSILLHDLFPGVRLTATDIRDSILVNLRNRLKRAGINHVTSFVADVASDRFALPQMFDIIICDAPCSGSGTWGRTPEQLRFFRQEKIDHYVSLQKSIALNSSRSLKRDGFFLYITCSVFRRENEEVVQYLQENSTLKLLSQQYLKGYDKKGDTLFTALFTT